MDSLYFIIAINIIIAKIKKMTEKQTNSKEARHESAKNKYHHFQRVLSCKNLIKVYFK